MRRFALTTLVALALAACGDEAPVPGPGTMTATVISPNASEGAAVVTVTGPGIQAVTSTGPQVFSEIVGQTATVVVINEPGGLLSFGLSVDDTLATFTGAVLEVASPVDILRSSLAEYSLEIRR